MPADARTLAEEWFRKAEDDLLSVRAILREGAPSTACFLSQQIAEKYLKGLLVLLGKPFPKVHDLLELETFLQAFSPDIRLVHAELLLLNRYYIETRYPGDFPAFSAEEARASFDAALRVKELVLKRAGRS